MHCYCREHHESILAFTKHSLHPNCMDEHQRYIIHEKWDDLIKIILFTVIISFARDFCAREIRKLVYKERREELNRVYSSMVIRFSLLKICLSMCLFFFVYFLDYKQNYKGLIDMLFYSNFTDFRWDLIQISVRKTVILLILEGIAKSGWRYYKGKLRTKNFTDKKSAILNSNQYYKNRNDPEILKNEIKIEDAYSDIIHILLLTFGFGMAIPEIFLISGIYIACKWKYYIFFCKSPVSISSMKTN